MHIISLIKGVFSPMFWCWVHLWQPMVK